VLLALVVLLHVLVLDWLGRHLGASSVLRPLPPPLFTRVLEPKAPPPVPSAAPAEVAAPARPSISSVAKAPPKRKRAASEPAAPPERPPPTPAAVEEPMSEVAPAGEETVAAAPDVPASDAAAAASSAPAPTLPQAEPAQSAASAAEANLDGWPTDTRLHYRLGGVFRSGELHGNARVQWLRQGERYEARIDIDITLLVSLTLTSQGQVTAAGLKPEVYEELRRSGPRTARLREDTIVLANGRTVPRPEGVQDTASQFVNLSRRFALGHEPLEVGRSVSFWMARPGGVDLWTYDIVDKEILRTPSLGPVEAFHLKPRPIANPRGNVTAEMWFAPSLQYLPVRIRVNMGETHVDLMVDTIEQR
jgi:hypothetical protein